MVSERLKLLYVAAVIVLAAASCGKEKNGDGTGAVNAGLFQTDSSWLMPSQESIVVQNYLAPSAPFPYDVTYEYDSTNFPNPERGPYNPLSFDYYNGSIPGDASVTSMAKTRQNGCSLVFFLFYLRDFLESPISEAALQHINRQFDKLREAGCKAIVRFAYCWDSNSKYVQEPYADVILGHIEQLKPIFQQHADVIHVVQMGFVGTYGEWAYVTRVTKRSERSDIVKAVLDALPEKRMVALRTPTHMRNTIADVNGLSKVTLKDTLTAEEAFTGTYKARLACFNDCAFVNSNDGGTYADEVDRAMWKSISNYVLLGGESCYQGRTSYCECLKSYENLIAFHWSYLSNHHDIIKIWKELGCYDDASCRVGYRFVLNGAAFEGEFAAGKKLTLRYCLGNYGFASLINPHNIEYVITGVDEPSEKYVIKSEFDPRLWKGSHFYTRNEEITLPAGLKAGLRYDFNIAITDPEPTLHDNPAYSIRFANTGVWNDETGLNRMATFTAK